MNRFLTAAVAVSTVALLMTSCTKHQQNPPAPPPPPPPNPTQVADKPVTEEPSGLRPGAPGPTRPIDNGDNGDVDKLAALSIADIEQFWTGAYPTWFKGKFNPVTELFSWDERFKHGKFCGEDTYDVYNAMWCQAEPSTQNCTSAEPPKCTPSNNTIGWDRGGLMPDMRDTAGDLGVPLVLSHEYGHSIQYTMADLIHGDSVEWATTGEQQADCFAGVYMRWVVDGKSPRFTLNNGDGLNKVMIAMIMLRDPLLAQVDPEQATLVHGSAFERVTAFQMGFDGGGSACATIDPQEIAQRRASYPKDFLTPGKTGEVPITQDSVKANVEALTKAFSPADPPKVSFDPASCPDAKTTPPASYCPSTNTINVDLNRLVLLGTRLSRGSPMSGSMMTLSGDYTAFSTVLSRYMLAVQKQHGGLALDNANAGLRTACLTGVASAKLAKGVPISDGNTVQLTAGDLDEAVFGLLTNGLVASNVNGDYAPSSFARVDAFRAGVLGDQDGCLKQFS
ncbi:MAG TPA: neutral zinc metallopeptidase [Mycobacterium sp.]|nr:neutral zinc metallopeptidase [Mycobacterium sp.]